MPKGNLPSSPYTIKSGVLFFLHVIEFSRTLNELFQQCRYFPLPILDIHIIQYRFDNFIE